MANIILKDVEKELNVHLANNPTLIPGALNSKSIQIDQYAKPIMKVKGEYPSTHTFITNVVQGFKPEWNNMGGLSVVPKKLVAHHQKVNFGLIPTEIRNSYFGALYNEGKKPQDMSFSKYALENELIPKVISDVSKLSVNGTYDATRLGEFGYSMNGVIPIVNNLKTNTENPCFKIPLSVITDTNIVDQVTLFERSLPEDAKDNIEVVFMSQNNMERYSLDYEDRFGQNKFQENKLKSRLGGRSIVGLKGYKGDEIFAFAKGNLVRLLDDVENPATITDIQTQDYELKIFMEFTRGYDFLVNQQVFVSNYADETLGLGSTKMNQNYYGIDGVTVTV